MRTVLRFVGLEIPLSSIMCSFRPTAIATTLLVLLPLVELQLLLLSHTCPGKSQKARSLTLQRVQHPLVTELDLVSQILREFGDKINVGIHRPFECAPFSSCFDNLFYISDSPPLLHSHHPRRHRLQCPRPRLRPHRHGFALVSPSRFDAANMVSSGGA